MRPSSRHYTAWSAKGQAPAGACGGLPLGGVHGAGYAAALGVFRHGPAAVLVSRPRTPQSPVHSPQRPATWRCRPQLTRSCPSSHAVAGKPVQVLADGLQQPERVHLPPRQPALHLRATRGAASLVWGRSCRGQQAGAVTSCCCPGSHPAMRAGRGCQTDSSWGAQHAWPCYIAPLSAQLRSVEPDILCAWSPGSTHAAAWRNDWCSMSALPLPPAAAAEASPVRCRRVCQKQLALLHAAAGTWLLLLLCRGSAHCHLLLLLTANAAGGRRRQLADGPHSCVPAASLRSAIALQLLGKSAGKGST